MALTVRLLRKIRQWNKVSDIGLYFTPIPCLNSRQVSFRIPVPIKSVVSEQAGWLAGAVFNAEI